MKFFGTVAAVLLLPAASLLHAQSSNAADPDFFETKVRPVLANNCFACHAESGLGGLRLDSEEAMKKGGMRGPAVVPGDLAKSLLITAIKQTDPGLKMPMGGKLTDPEIKVLEAWVKAGAVWPKASAKSVSGSPGKYSISPERRAFWSFKPLQEPPVPNVTNPKWSKNDIDRFVLARLEKEGLK